ncbi:MAG: hypothetical protein LKF53_08240 [Solobacterium sp.]|jgi:hypothetical protein|nr:hypothetical protein [Solobacterium sp.]MCH4206366.1 hypothetical protein [Solobacterium sp.]MCH4227868.1 hypothetical protein [Solobacterium sp.]MCH4283240.1 hypothetical protein [Solobacterium sp.]
MKAGRLKISLLCNLLTVLLEAIGAGLYVCRSGWNFAEFYTEDSNVFAMLACLCLALCEMEMLRGKRTSIPGWIQFAKYISAVCLTLTFLVVIFVLIPMQGGISTAHFMLVDGSMLYHHLFCPILVFVSFVWLDPLDPLAKKDTMLVLVPTLIYAGILIVLNLLQLADGPYPFLRITKQPWYASVLWMCLLLAGTYGIAWMLRALEVRQTDR